MKPSYNANNDLLSKRDTTAVEHITFMHSSKTHSYHKVAPQKHMERVDSKLVKGGGRGQQNSIYWKIPGIHRPSRMNRNI